MSVKDTTGTGEASTVQLIAALVLKKKRVWVPFVDSNRRADLLMEDDSGIHRVQCKTGRIRNGCVEFKTCSVHRRQSGIGYEHRGYTGQVDFFGVYCPDNNHSYLVPIAVTRKGCCCIRIEEPRTRGGRKVQWARDFQL